ncbi:hypothetical protein NDU88_005615 [Pleurodeles waltl]|uniref:Uncharacterized protein n=1 Tax=Pleurodeles waltl TaxID=8319 RepID=A0AAV7NR41_PLEWA|nr:hypothetical protein NDU88_005615 [Pleurodeles waltl]
MRMHGVSRMKGSWGSVLTDASSLDEWDETPVPVTDPTLTARKKRPQLGTKAIADPVVGSKWDYTVIPGLEVQPPVEAIDTGARIGPSYALLLQELSDDLDAVNSKWEA